MVNIIKPTPKLYVLDTGTMKMDKNYMIAIHTPASIDNPNPPAEFVEFPVYAVLIDHPEGKILFDTGCNPEGMGENGRWPEGVQKMFPSFQDESCYLINRLAQLNHVLKISNMLWPHTYTLIMLAAWSYLQMPTIIVHDTEHTNTMKQYAMTRDMGAYIWADVNAWINNGLKWKTVMPHEDELELAQGIKILNFGPGHAWGLLGLHVELPGEGGII